MHRRARLQESLMSSSDNKPSSPQRTASPKVADVDVASTVAELRKKIHVAHAAVAQADRTIASIHDVQARSSTPANRQRLKSLFNALQKETDSEAVQLHDCLETI